jgi:uncharacterized protein
VGELEMGRIGDGEMGDSLNIPRFLIKFFTFHFSLFTFHFLLFTFVFYLFTMNCRSDCGACCIGISISSSIPGMPDGKPAGVRCIHLLEDYRCALFGDPSRPKVCSDYQAEELFCGTDRNEAISILRSLEKPKT